MGWIDAEPDLTLSEIAVRVEEETGYRPPPSVVHEFFQRHDVTRKKRQRTRPSKTART